MSAALWLPAGGQPSGDTTGKGRPSPRLSNSMMVASAARPWHSAPSDRLSGGSGDPRSVGTYVGERRWNGGDGGNTNPPPPPSNLLSSFLCGTSEGAPPNALFWPVSGQISQRPRPHQTWRFSKRPCQPGTVFSVRISGASHDSRSPSSVPGMAILDM